MKLPLTFDALRDSVQFLGEFASSTKQGRIKEFREGKVPSVEFRATVYVHGQERVKNPVVLNESELEGFAKSFVGQPFLADHSREQGKRGGTIRESELVDVDGKKAIRQTIEAVKPWAVEGVLDGTIDRFSIGWFAQKYDCTVCKSEYGGAGCKHDFYDLGSKDKESGDKVMVLMSGLEGMETSAVTHPAVPGTGVADFSSQFQEWLRDHAFGNSAGANGQEAHMIERVKQLLGLPASATEPEALSTLEARLASAPGIPKALCLALGVPENATADQVTSKALAITAPGNFIAREDHDKVVEELSMMKASEAVRSAMAQGKVTPAMEKWAVSWAKREPEAFASYVAQAPVQMPLASAGVQPPVIENKEKVVGLTEEELLVAKRLRQTPAEFLKSKQEVAEYDARA